MTLCTYVRLYNVVMSSFLSDYSTHLHAYGHMGGPLGECPGAHLGLARETELCH